MWHLLKVKWPRDWIRMTSEPMWVRMKQPKYTSSFSNINFTQKLELSSKLNLFSFKFFFKAVLPYLLEFEEHLQIKVNKNSWIKNLYSNIQPQIWIWVIECPFSRCSAARGSSTGLCQVGQTKLKASKSSLFTEYSPEVKIIGMVKTVAKLVTGCLIKMKSCNVYIRWLKSISTC